MSVATQDFYSQMQTGQGRLSGIETRSAKWSQVAYGAVALGLYLVLAATTASLWPVLVGPFVLIGVTRLMGLRSLWRVSEKDFKPRGAFGLGLLERACGEADASRPTKSDLGPVAEEPSRVIEKLKRGLEKGGKKYAGTAYAIGRQYMRLGQYEQAREWLRRPRREGTERSVSEASVKASLHACDLQLLSEGDACFADGDYQGARERYARLSPRLAHREGKRFAIFLRSACVYCELQDYEDARQALLQALKFDQETDKALVLLGLLEGLSRHEGGADQKASVRGRAEKRLAGQVADIMATLRAQRPGLTGSSDRLGDTATQSPTGAATAHH